MPAAKSSGGMIWIALVALVVLGLGVWYVLRSRNSGDVTPAPTATQQTAPAPKAQPVSEPKAEPAAAPAASQEASQQSNEPAKQSAASSSPSAGDAQRSANRREQVAASVRQGDFYYQNGQYDNAIREYEKGLSADPTSAVLRQKIDRAKRAKATEEALQ